MKELRIYCAFGNACLIKIFHQTKVDKNYL